MNDAEEQQEGGGKRAAEKVKVKARDEQPCLHNLMSAKQALSALPRRICCHHTIDCVQPNRHDWRTL